LVASQSRSGFIGFLISIIPLAYFYLKRCSIKKRLLFVIISLIVLFTISSWIIANKELYEALITVDTSSGSDQTRINLIKNGLIFLVNSLFLGVGLGNIEYHMATNAFYLTQYINIHNWWMEILVSSGVFIFIIYIVIYTKSLLRLYHMSLGKKDKDIMVISTCFFCFLIAFLIAAVGSSSSMTSEWLWPAMAVVMSFVNSGSKSILTN
jgi:teichuronic acid biosynthesis protein TuaE